MDVELRSHMGAHLVAQAAEREQFRQGGTGVGALERAGRCISFGSLVAAGMKARSEREKEEEEEEPQLW
jgi:hypothetical protein